MELRLHDRYCPQNELRLTAINRVHRLSLDYVRKCRQVRAGIPIVICDVDRDLLEVIGQTCRPYLLKVDYIRQHCSQV